MSSNLKVTLYTNVSHFIPHLTNSYVLSENVFEKCKSRWFNKFADQ